MVSLIQKKSVEAAFFLANPWFAKASYFIGCRVSFICYGDSIVRRLYWRILLAGIIHEAILFYFPPTRKEERRLLDHIYLYNSIGIGQDSRKVDGKLVKR